MVTTRLHSFTFFATRLRKKTQPYTVGTYILAVCEEKPLKENSFAHTLDKVPTF